MPRTPVLLTITALLAIACDVSNGDAGQFIDDTDLSGEEPAELSGVTVAHNLIRRPLGLNDLAWDDGLAEISADWVAQLVASGCHLEHNWDSPYGENLYWTSESAVEPDEAVYSWASEVQYYDYESNTCADGQQCGHYTQIVWADTERVGCATQSCSGNGEIWMCSYDPAGNWVGEWPY